MRADSSGEALLSRLESLAKQKKFNRREFIALAGAVSAGSIVASQLGPLRHVLANGTAGGSADGILVLVYLGGGNDGLNTVIPLVAKEYDEYQRTRTKIIGGVTSSLAYPRPGAGRSDEALAGDLTIGFNPGLGNVSSWYRSGKVAVVQGIGYSQPSYSHFESGDQWAAGTGSAGTFALNPQSGWLGRYSERAGLSPLGLIAINAGTEPLAIRGLATEGVALSTWSGPRLGGSNSFSGDVHAASAVSAMATPSRTGLAAQWADLGSRAIAAAPTINAASSSNFPSGSSNIKRQLIMAANLVNAEIGARVVHCDHGGFDTHENQRRDSNGNDWHRLLLADLDDALGTFFSTLNAGIRRKVTVMVYSEFGRRPEMNASFGTDHGSASVAFVVGDNVRGGRYGEYPSLLDLDDENLKSTVDFRSLYSSLLGNWLGIDPVSVIGAAHAPLLLFVAGPGVDPTATTTTVTPSTTAAPSITTTTQPATTTTLSPTTTVVVTSTTSVATTTVAPTTTGPTTTIANPTTTIVTTTTSPVSTIAPSTSAPTSSTTVVPSSIAAPTSTAAPTSAPSTTTPTTTAPATTTPATTAPTTTTPSTGPATTSSTTTTAVPATTTTTSRSTTTTVAKKSPMPAPPGNTPSPATPDAPNIVVDQAPISPVISPVPEPTPTSTTTTTSTKSTTSTTSTKSTTSTSEEPTTTKAQPPSTSTALPVASSTAPSSTSSLAPTTTTIPKRLALRPRTTVTTAKPNLKKARQIQKLRK